MNAIENVTNIPNVVSTPEDSLFCRSQARKRPDKTMLRTKLPILCSFLLTAGFLASVDGATDPRLARFWALKPVVRAELPAPSSNPIDSFVNAKLAEKGLRPTGKADKRTLLRRVYMDLTGIPPTPEEQDKFLQDSSPDAYEKVVDRLLANEQHGVRYARRWLDVLRYTDVDDRMAAESGIHHWRDWVISALNEDLAYDKFVRAQLTGYRDPEYTTIDENGNRRRSAPRNT